MSADLGVATDHGATSTNTWALQAGEQDVGCATSAARQQRRNYTTTMLLLLLLLLTFQQLVVGRRVIFVT